MHYTVTKQIIQILGTMWMPSTTAAAIKELSAYDMENLGDPHNREDVQRWLDTNTGDFASITDFRADFTIGEESIVHDWQSEDSYLTFCDCMYGVEDFD